MVNKDLTVGLIGTGSQEWIAGVNYISSLLYANSLLSQSEKNKFHLFLHEFTSPEDDYETVLQYAENIGKYGFHYGPDFPYLRRISQSLKRAWHEGKFPRRINNNLPELLIEAGCQVIFPANDFVRNGPASVKTISWIPDFQYKYYPENFPNLKRVNSNIKRVLRYSDLVIVSNKYSKENVQNFFPKYAHKTRVMPFTMWLGPAWNFSDYKNVIQKYNLPEKYLIFPSQFWVHKNHKRLFEAVRITIQRAHKDFLLVCTGYPNDHRTPAYMEELHSFIKEHDLQENILLLGLIPRFEQIQLLRGAAAMVQPSLFEGYSALLDEAQSLGKRVIVSDIPMHREQQFDNCIFFDPHDTLDLAQKLGDVWPSLLPGPEPDSEAAALTSYSSRLKSFGEKFRDICLSIT